MTFKASCIAAIASLALASGASAQTFSPNGPRDLVSDGKVTVTKGLTLQCDLTGNASANAGSAQVDSLALSGTSGLYSCSTISFTGTPYAITSGSPGTLTFNNVVVTAITGNCAGSITGAFDQSTGVLTFNNATLPSTSGGNDCSITGNVIIDPTLNF